MTKLAANQLDLVFVIDTTGSMGSFIEDAKKKLLTTIESLLKDKNKDLNVGVVAYRDHPPQDKSYLARVFKLTDQIEKIKNNIKSLTADGGGDVNEAVFDGLNEACKINWRKNAKRVAILVGDALGHDKCLCGQTKESIAAEVESNNITLYAIPLTPTPEKQFDFICKMTGGQVKPQTYNAVSEITNIINKEFENCEFDQQVLDLYIDGKNENDISIELKTNLNNIMVSIGRLRSRELICDEQLVKIS